MINIKTILLAFFTLIIFYSNSNADLSDAEVIKTSGNWSVRQSKDFLTDETICTALYKDRFDIQVNEGVFYINMKGKGGVSLVKYRIDDNDAKTYGNYDSTMRSSGVIKFKHDVIFKSILSAKRLRVQVYTLLEELVNHDIDLNGLAEVYPTLLSPQCK